MLGRFQRIKKKKTFMKTKEEQIVPSESSGDLQLVFYPAVPQIGVVGRILLPFPCFGDFSEVFFSRDAVLRESSPNPERTQ